MRKEGKLEISDRIRIGYDVPQSDRQSELTDAIKIHQDYIMNETLAKKIVPMDGTFAAGTDWNINGINMKMAIVKEDGV